MKKNEALEKFYEILSFDERDRLKEDPEAFYCELRGFPTPEEVNKIQEEMNKPPLEFAIYTDGSFREGMKYGGWAFAVFDKNGNNIFDNSGVVTDKEMLGMRNVAGEITAAEHAIKFMQKIPGKKDITIYHDYEGVSKWANNEWKANNKYTQEYKEFIKFYRSPDFNIKFEQVPAHSNIKNNELVDGYAKKAIEVYDRDKLDTKLVELNFEHQSRTAMDDSYAFNKALIVGDKLPDIANWWMHRENVKNEPLVTAKEMLDDFSNVIKSQDKKPSVLHSNKEHENSKSDVFKLSEVISTLSDIKNNLKSLDEVGVDSEGDVDKTIE